MEQEKFNRAIDIKDELRRLRRLQNDANQIIKCHNDHGICKQYWDEIGDLMWSDEVFKKKNDTRLFCLLEEFKINLLCEIRQLEAEFDSL